MFFRLRLEGLETRENPSGPGTLDPLEVPTTPTTPPAETTPPPPQDPAPTDPNHPIQ
jgi:hypothetical protein